MVPAAERLAFGRSSSGSSKPASRAATCATFFVTPATLADVSAMAAVYVVVRGLEVPLLKRLRRARSRRLFVETLGAVWARSRASSAATRSDMLASWLSRVACCCSRISRGPGESSGLVAPLSMARFSRSASRCCCSYRRSRLPSTPPVCTGRASRLAAVSSASGVLASESRCLRLMLGRRPSAAAGPAPSSELPCPAMRRWARTSRAASRSNLVGRGRGPECTPLEVATGTLLVFVGPP
jgi:hypothetical protein